MTADTNPGFIGRWDLTIREAGKGEMPSWLELGNENGTWRGNFVGRWGSARLLPTVAITGNQIHFISPKAEEGSENDLAFDGQMIGDTIRGTAVGPDKVPWIWTARRAPALLPPTAAQWDAAQSLFTGTNLSGWFADRATPSPCWVATNGCLVNVAGGANLITSNSFQDFKLHVEFNCPVNGNSGVYLRGRYEVQVEEDSVLEPPSHHMGAIYGFLAPDPAPPRVPGTWQSFDITLLGRFVTVKHNGKLTINHQEIPGLTGGALDSREGEPGPIYLQGDEHKGTAFRNLVLTPIKP